MEAIPPKLAAALVQAQIAAKAVEKDSRNKHHDYGYASAEAIITASRDPLNAAGVAVIPRGLELRESPVGMAEKTTARITFAIVHSSGEQVADFYDQPVVPERGRPTDKATASARTTALGYFLRDLLQLPRVDTEVDQRDDREPERQKEQQRRPEPAKPLSEGERLSREPGADDVTGQEMLRDAAERIVGAYGEVGKQNKPRTAEVWKKESLPEPKTWKDLSAAQALVFGVKAKAVADQVVMMMTVKKAG